MRTTTHLFLHATARVFQCHAVMTALRMLAHALRMGEDGGGVVGMTSLV